MEKDADIRIGRHCVFKMHVHLVFVTKYRRGVFTKEMLEDLMSIFANVCTDFEAELAEFNGADDYVHLLVTYPPKLAVSSLVNSLKGVSSRLIRKRGYPGLTQKLCDGSLWSPSYFAGSCAGSDLSDVQNFIATQRLERGKKPDHF